MRSWEEQIRHAYEVDELSVREIADIIGSVSRTTIWQRLVAMGVKMRPRGSLRRRRIGRKLTWMDVMLIKRRQAAGGSDADVAQEFAISRYMAWKIRNGKAWKDVMTS